MKENEVKLNLVSITLMDDKEWEEYFYIGKNRTEEYADPKVILKFKSDRLEQNENAPSWVTVNEYILKYEHEPIGWLACFESENISIINDTIYDEIPNEVLNSLLYRIYEIISNGKKEFVYFGSKNSSICQKLEALGAELLEPEGDETSETRFYLTKSFLEKYGE
jgi:predicted nucleic acid-binding OB-fold protein